MPTETEPAFRPWTMTFRVSREPRCPGCCVALAGVVITFNEGWAWCPVCTDEQLYAQSHLRYVLHHSIMERASILSHGLRFYVPTPSNGTIPNAIDAFDTLLNQPQSEAAAVAAWPSFTIDQLPESVRIRDREKYIRFRRTTKIPHGYEIVGLTDTGRVVLMEMLTSEPA